MSNPPLKTTERAINIIEVMRNQGYMTLQNISERVDMKKPTVHNQLNTLEHCGYIEKKGYKYRLGLQFFSLGYDILNSLTSPQGYDEYVDTVSAETGYRSIIVVEEKQIGYVISVSAGNYPNWGRQPMGRAIKLHRFAIGKAILAEYDHTEFDDYIDTHFPTDDMHRITAATVREDVKTIRENDVAYVDDQGVIAKACAFNQGDKIFAIGAHAPKNQETIEVSDTRLDEVLLNVKSDLNSSIKNN
jgi:DNA-binding IclR family transcriptional regulator